MTVGIIGGGASGIMAALRLREKDIDVILLEKNDKIGKKILVTGNGKCNIWNMNLLKNNIDSKAYYNTDNYNFLDNILTKSNEVYTYLCSHFYIHTINKGDYIYPYNYSSQSVREIMEKTLINNGVNIINNFNVVKIENEDNKVLVYDQNNEYYTFDKVIIACGLKSSNLGTDSIDILLSDVKVNKMYPSLVPIKLNESFLKEWNGVRSDVTLSLYDNNTLIKEEIGEAQFTDYGISGIVSFNLSGLINRLNKSLTLKINFMSDVNYEVFKGYYLSDKDITIDEALETTLNYKIKYLIFKKAHIDKSSKCGSLKEEDIISLYKIITEFEVCVAGTLDYSRSQVTTGGISLNEINNDFSLKNNSNIYTIGEILDIDGICGGYNLAISFITGYIAGGAIND